MPHKNFKPPAHALDVFKVMDWDVCIVQNPYQPAPGNYETFSAQAVNSQGRTIGLGNPQQNASTQQFSWPKTPWEACQRIIGLIAREPPKAITTTPVPNYLGFKFHVEQRLAKRHPKSRRFHGKATKEFSRAGAKVPITLEAYGPSAQIVINELRHKAERMSFYDMMLNGGKV